MKVRNSILFSLIAGLIPALLMLVSGGGFSLAAWLLSTVSIFILVWIWRWMGGSRTVAWMIAIAFALRLLTAVFLDFALPAWGYDEPAPQAGYVFLDAYNRDNEAWDLSQSDKPLWRAFGEDIRTDQYGGLMALSASVYRYLSPDLHRPLLIVLLSAFFAALGVPFLWLAAKSLSSERAANIAGWIFVLYPESVLLGASQMREPFIMGLTSISFWAVLDGSSHRRRALAVFAASMVGLVLISSRVAVPILAVMAGWYWLLYGHPEQVARWKIALVAGIVLVAIGIYGYAWLRETAGWDATLTRRASGWIQLLIKMVGKRYLLELVTVYGLTQPLLPAAIIEPGAPIANAISTIRALGWYAIVPPLLYGAFAAWKLPTAKEKRLAFWLAGISLAWIVIASLRAGGDAWDNPRYRTHFMIWIALLAGQAIIWARERHSPWLIRVYGMELAFLVPVTLWYIGRYWKWFPPLPFGLMIALALGLATAIILGGWLWDSYHRRLSTSIVDEWKSIDSPTNQTKP